MIKIGNGLDQTFFERNPRFPTKQFLCPRDVGLTLLGIVLRQRTMDDARARTGQARSPAGEFHDRELGRIADIDRSGHCRWRP